MKVVKLNATAPMIVTPRLQNDPFSGRASEENIEVRPTDKKGVHI